MFDEGVAAYVKNDFKKSVLLFSRAVKYNPKFDLSYVSRGFVYLKLNKIKEAMADFDRAIKLNPHNARAYHLRGLAYEKLEDIAGAFQNFDRALEIDPEYGPAYHSRDSILSKDGNTDYTIEELDIINHLMAMRVSRFDDHRQSGDLAA